MSKYEEYSLYVSIGALLFSLVALGISWWNSSRFSRDKKALKKYVGEVVKARLFYKPNEYKEQYILIEKLTNNFVLASLVNIIDKNNVERISLRAYSYPSIFFLFRDSNSEVAHNPTVTSQKNLD